jgi:ubiquinone/menaquinone biosynthesis C-methylase UbiE
MTDPPRGGDTELQPYWDRVSRAYPPDDPLAAVCYPGAPVWLNRFFAGLQWGSVRRATSGIELGGVRALDVGCGFGRWTRWLAQRGASVVGVDPTEGMLEAARRASDSSVEYRRMSATALDLPDSNFDVVTCITVIQHLEPSEQDAAVAEIARVLRPGGRAVALDLIDLHDRGKIVYPRSASDWIRLYAEHGLAIERWEGQEFVPLIRGFRWLAEAVGRLLGLGGGQREGASLLEETSGRGAFRIAYAGLWVLVQLSRVLEPPCRWMLPGAWARHGCFVFRKA